MIEINERDKIFGEEIHKSIESKLTDYSIWVKRKIEYADLIEGKDFTTILLQSTGGRPKKEYEFTIDAAKEICLLEKNKKGKEIRRWLIGLSKQREDFDLITVKEAAFAVKVINCLKYIDNQKEAYSIHQKKFFDSNVDMLNKKYIYSEFAQYRTKIIGWDKASIDKAIDLFLKDHVGYNKGKIEKSNMATKLSIMDIGEAIRVAVLDILYSKETDLHLANKFSVLCKKLANEMHVIPEKENNNNLFRNKEQIDSVKSIDLYKSK